MDLSIITVTYNSERHIAEQMRSVASACRGIAWEFFLVDNASADRTVACIQEQRAVLEDAPITCIINKENLGFTAANNLAAARATGRYLLFLNPDMRIVGGVLDDLVAWMDAQHDVGIAGGKLVDPAGRPLLQVAPRRFPRVRDLTLLLLKVPHVAPRVLKRYTMAGFDAEKEQAVDSVRGSFLLLRREIYDAHGWAFDPRYRTWFEDVDLCREARAKGWRVMHTPIITCIDKFGQSFSQRTHVTNQKEFTRGMLTYVKKWEPWYAALWIAVLRPAGIALAWLGDVLS